MKIALVNPNWKFEGSIYFGCREPHLPLEYGYSQALLRAAGHEVAIMDGQLEDLAPSEIENQIRQFDPAMTVVTTAPSYLFWRCAPPELRVPRELLSSISGIGGMKVIIGPHVSTTPRAALRKLNADVGIIGEPEEVLPVLAATPKDRWPRIASICYWNRGEVIVQGGHHQSNMQQLPVLRWPAKTIQNHRHHHHRFDSAPEGPGAEIETSRGCPYHCSFCAKDNFRSDYRKRPHHVVLEEIDGLIESGARYFYFVDEIFLPDSGLLTGIRERGIQFGIQTRIDLWKPEMLHLLGSAGCVSIEAGVESITEEGRDLLDKKCKLSTDELGERLIYAKEQVPFVQANLLECKVDDDDSIDRWRSRLLSHGVWANKPVPLFPYPGSPDYTKIWGAPDDMAWERAHAFYLQEYSRFSDIQEDRPLSLPELEKIA